MNPLRAWNRFWFGPISARPLGVFRVAFGLILLAHLAIVSVDFDHWYTDAGLLRGTEARETAGAWRPSVLQWVQDPASAHLFYAATVAVALFACIFAVTALQWRFGQAWVYGNEGAS